MNEPLFSLGLAYGPRILVAALILVAGYFTGKWAANALDARLQRHSMEPPVRQLLEASARVLILGLAAILALQNLGVELMPLIAGLGVAGAAIALATQGVLGNIAAGLTIIFTRPFRVGDHVSLLGVEGEVLEIRLASTTLGHADLSRVVVPNRKIVGEILHNYGRIRQLALEVGVPHEADLTLAIETAHSVLRVNRRVLQDPPPRVWVSRLGDSASTLSIAPWVDVRDFSAAPGEIHQALREAFRHRAVLRPQAQAA